MSDRVFTRRARSLALALALVTGAAIAGEVHPKMDVIDATLLARIEKAWGEAAPSWGSVMDLPGGRKLAVLTLPADRLPSFDSRTGYWCHVGAYQASTPLVLVQLNSFRLGSDLGGWAIPTKYTPRNEHEAIRQSLGFDEGWEESTPDRIVVLRGVGWRDWLARARQEERIGISRSGEGSVYPMKLGETNLQALDRYLDAHPPKPSHE